MGRFVKVYTRVMLWIYGMRILLCNSTPLEGFTIKQYFLVAL